MDKVEKVKNVIKRYYKDAGCGCFFTRNIVGDEMENVYIDSDVAVDICFGWAYFEVFGLNEEEQEEIIKYYDSL